MSLRMATGPVDGKGPVGHGGVWILSKAGEGHLKGC